VIYPWGYFSLMFLLCHCRCRGCLLHLITLKCTPHFIGLPWTQIWTVTETSTCTSHNTRETKTSMPLAEFKPAVPASEQLQTRALDRAATGAILGKFVGRIWKNCRITFIKLASSHSDIRNRAFLTLSQNIYRIIQTTSSK